jgi:acyl-CoA thioester hydrolase
VAAPPIAARQLQQTDVCRHILQQGNKDEGGNMRRVFRQTIIAPETAIDVNGHVNNVEYVRWMQEVATAHSSAVGWTTDRYRQIGTSWVIRSHSIEYLRPAFAGDPIVMLTWIAAIDEQTSPRKYLFLRDSDQKILARAETLWVFVDARAGRPTRIPDEFRDAFEIVTSEADALRETT